MEYIYIVVIATNIVAFVAGTIQSWTSPVLDRLNDTSTTPFSEPITLDQRTWISSFFPIGAIFGPFLFGYLADLIGRKKTLLISGVPFVICYYMLAFGRSVGIYYVARFLLGAALGGVYTVVPMYVGEIAANENRGTLSSIMNVLLCFGIFFSYLVGPYMSLIAFNVLLGTIPLLFLVLFAILAPESPHYYLSKNMISAAKESLRKIRSKNYDINNEIEVIMKKIDEDGRGNVLDIFRSKALTKALLITVGLAAFQQFSGVIAVFFYAQPIFKASGSSMNPTICSIIIGFIQFSTSFITPLLIDRWGRKLLLLVSAIGMALAEIPLGVYCYLNDHHYDVSSISFLPVLCLVCYIFLYNFGYGPLPWIIMGEVFPPSVKSSASSITAGICWLIGFFVSKYFEPMALAIGMGQSFWIFSAFCLAAVPFGIFFVVETKGKNFIEIQKELAR